MLHKLEAMTPGILVSKVTNEIKGIALARARHYRCFSSKRQLLKIGWISIFSHANK